MLGHCLVCTVKRPSPTSSISNISIVLQQRLQFHLSIWLSFLQCRLSILSSVSSYTVSHLPLVLHRHFLGQFRLLARLFLFQIRLAIWAYLLQFASPSVSLWAIFFYNFPTTILLLWLYICYRFWGIHLPLISGQDRQHFSLFFFSLRDFVFYSSNTPDTHVRLQNFFWIEIFYPSSSSSVCSLQCFPFSILHGSYF